MSARTRGSRRQQKSGGERVAEAVERFRAGDIKGAHALCQKILKREPGHGDALNLLANIHLQQGKPDLALPLLERAIARYPSRAAYHANRSMSLNQLHRFSDSEQSAREALRLAPALLEARNNLAVALEGLDRLEEAEQELRRLIDPQQGGVAATLADTAYNLSSVLLKRGRWREGWEMMAHRWQSRRFQSVARARSEAPRWSGERLPDATLLIWSEQGFGDTIQFMRFIPLIRERVGHILLECREPLIPLAGLIGGIDQIIPRSASGQPIGCDRQVALMDLPGVLAITPDTLPDNIPYITLPAGEAVLPAPEPGALAIGLVWAGNPDHQNDRLRSIPFDRLQPLWEALPAARFYSLQLGEARHAASRHFSAGSLTDLSARLGDFTETARVLTELDYLITVDTSVAHLAGAMGRPGAVLLAHAGDWRWYPDGERSLWYPSLDQIRQRSAGEWESVISRVAALIERLADKRQRSNHQEAAY